MKFTDAKIKSLKPKKFRYEIWEDGHPGFGIRVFPSGVKSWVLMFRPSGSNTVKRMTIGKYPNVSLHKAHKIEAEAREKASKGEDPSNEAITKRRAHRDAMLVNELSVEFIEKYAHPRKKTYKEDERILNTYINPVIGKRKAKDVKRGEIIEILDEIGERAPIQANRVLACTRKMFNFALEREIVENNPCHGISQPNKEKARERVLDDDEIKKVWSKLTECPMLPIMQSALKLLFVTAQRKQEVVTMEWREIDFKKKLWEIPSSKTKNGKSHIVPLSPLAITLLKELKNDSEYVFPSTVNDGPITGQAVDRAVRNSRETFGIPQFTPHDFRRTAATKMTELGISRFDVSRVLNHTDASVTARYDKNLYLPEKKKALDVWAKHLTKQIKEI